MNVLYPAISSEGLTTVCERLAAVFKLPQFHRTYSSQHLAIARSGDAFQITVTEFVGSVNAEQAARIGAPDHWNLAWRAAVGLRFNYQVAIARGAVTRSQQRTIGRRLRSVFTEVRLHGESVAPNEKLK
jgi:hypothetical protein